MKRNNLALLVLFLLASCVQHETVGQEIRGTPIGSPPAANQAVPPPSGVSTNLAASVTKEGYVQAGFDKLSGFPARVVYDLVNSNSPAMSYVPRLATPVPDDIRGLDGKKIAVGGFMLPLKMEEGRVTEFILLKNQAMCCYGRPPNVNEWVHVKMSKGIKPSMDETITILGILHVSEYKENSQMLGLYRLDGEKVETASGS